MSFDSQMRGWIRHATARDLVHAARHPYTRALISAAPIPDPAVERLRRATALKGDLPSPLAPPSGCVFRTRCPVAHPSCADELPVMRDYGNGHFAACPFGENIPEKRSVVAREAGDSH